MSQKNYRSSYWAGTLHGTSLQLKDFVEKLGDLTNAADPAKLLVYARGQEEYNESKRHLQFLVQLRSRATLSTLKKWVHNTCHWEMIENFYAMKNYVWKEETKVSIDDGGIRFEIGYYNGPGNSKRSHETLLENSAKRMCTLQTMLDKYGESDTILKIATGNIDLFPQLQSALQLKEMEDKARARNENVKTAFEFMDHLYPWQTTLNDILSKPVDDRRIYVIYEPFGNTGKSTFMNKYKSIHYVDTVILDNGKKGDMFHATQKQANR